MKYEIGDLVSKPVTGICKIDNILYLTEKVNEDDSIVIEIKKQYNTSPVGEYLTQ